MTDAKLVFGFDLGLNNVGWSVVRRHDDSVDVLQIGTYVFPSPLVEDKDATSGLKSRDRGMKRKARRTLERRSARKRRLYRILADHGFLPRAFEERTKFLCRNKEGSKKVDPFALRVFALDQRLEPFEVGRVLCHLNQRRGYLDPRDLMLKGVVRFQAASAETDDEEDEKTEKSAEKKERKITAQEIAQTKVEMAGCRTIGEFLDRRLNEDKKPVRKTKLTDKKTGKLVVDPERWVRPDRHMIEAECDLILEAQAKFHPLLTAELQTQIREILFRQRQIGSQTGLRGKCTFFPGETRAARASMVAQRFIIAQELAHLRLVAPGQKDERPLTPSERRTLFALLVSGDDLAWAEARRKVGVGDALRFTDEPNTKRQSGKAALRGSRTAIAIRRSIGDKWADLTESGCGLDDVVTVILTARHQASSGLSAAKARFDLLSSRAFGPNAVRFTEREAADLATLDLPDGYLNVSRKAIRKILPGLLVDLTYDQACAKCGLNHSAPSGVKEKLERLELQSVETIGHPLVRCAVKNAIRVFNDLAENYGLPDVIRIELPRDLAKSAVQREEDEIRMRQGEKVRNAARAKLFEAGLPVTKRNTDKVLLWEEFIDGLPYEPHIRVSSVEDLINGDYDIDHIIPRSYSFDDSRGNRTICTGQFNKQVKRDQTLFETFANDPARWQTLADSLATRRAKLPRTDPRRRKIDRMLSTRREDFDGFEGRHLAATGYISSVVLGLFQSLNVPEVTVAQGAATGHLRSLWGLSEVIPLHPEEIEMLNKEKERIEAEGIRAFRGPKQRSNFKHHALDALVVALTDRSSLLKVTEYFKAQELGVPRDANRIVTPDPNLIAKVIDALERATIVHRPDRKVAGQLNEATARTPNANIEPGESNSTRVVGKQLVRFDPTGKPAQAYDLGNNHHVVIWESLTPNAKGQFQRCGEVVTAMEANRRAVQGEPVFATAPRPGWRFVLTLCKGDMVEMADGGVGVVSTFSATEKKPADVNVVVWHSEVAEQAGKLNVANPYLIANIQTANRLSEIRRRVVYRPTGGEVFAEGSEG